MRWGAAALLLGVLASGCIGGPAGCNVPDGLRVLTPPVTADYMATDPAQPWDTVALSWPAAQGLRSATHYTLSPPAWNLTVESYPAASGGPVLEHLRVVPGAATNATLMRSWSLAQETQDSHGSTACRSGRGGSLAWDLRAPAAGTVAQPGMGVRVMTAGFWENGTLFYTNIHALHDSGWPRAGWYGWEGGDPLPVYVYDRDRGERPAPWSATTEGTPLGAPTQNATLWNYYTTIPGFNQALKGLSTSTVRVVHLRPEEAYTRAGNEAHPLYGSPLVFYIKLVAVERLPCPDSPTAMGPCPLVPAGQPHQGPGLAFSP
jgi:hypothetical protein